MKVATISRPGLWLNDPRGRLYLPHVCGIVPGPDNRTDFATMENGVKAILGIDISPEELERRVDLARMQSVQLTDVQGYTFQLSPRIVRVGPLVVHAYVANGTFTVSSSVSLDYGGQKEPISCLLTLSEGEKAPTVYEELMTVRTKLEKETSEKGNEIRWQILGYV